MVVIFLPYNTTSIITDSNLNPIPQQYNPFSGVYEPLQGRGSSSSIERGRWYIVGSGATTTTIPLTTQSGNSLFLTPSVANRWVGGIIYIMSGSTLYSACIVSVSSSGTVTLDSALPSAPSQGSPVLVTLPDLIIQYANIPRLVGTVPYSSFSANTTIYPVFMQVLSRNARQRTFIFSNTLNQPIGISNISLTDSLIDPSGGYNFGDGIGQLATNIPANTGYAVYTSELRSALIAHVDSFQVSISMGSTAPTSGNVQIYVVEVF